MFIQLLMLDYQLKISILFDVAVKCWYVQAVYSPLKSSFPQLSRHRFNLTTYLAQLLDPLILYSLIYLNLFEQIQRLGEIIDILLPDPSDLRYFSIFGIYLQQIPSSFFRKDKQLHPPIFYSSCTNCRLINFIALISSFLNNALPSPLTTCKMSLSNPDLWLNNLRVRSNSQHLSSYFWSIYSVRG